MVRLTEWLEAKIKDTQIVCDARLLVMGSRLPLVLTVTYETSGQLSVPSIPHLVKQAKPLMGEQDVPRNSPRMSKPPNRLTDRIRRYSITQTLKLRLSLFSVLPGS